MTSNAPTTPTTCFTYELTMVVQVLASDRAQADKQLDEQGGHVSSRVVTLKDAVELYSGTLPTIDSE